VKLDKSILSEVKQVVINSVASDITFEALTDEFPLVGNVLDSMAVTNLILALEEHFGFSFNDEELTAEAFETVTTLAQLVQDKVKA
jgi:acyl carrier protein